MLAHGFGGSARNFRPQARALADVCTLLTYDARGHARSEAPDDPSAYDFERLVDDYARVAASGGERVVAGGLSLGAITALAFAARRPERVRAVFLASLASTEDKQRAWALGFADAIERDGLDQAGAAFVWGERSRFDPAGAKLIRQGLLEHPPHALAHILRRTLAVLPDPAELAVPLRAAGIPVTMLVGSDDPGPLVPSQRLAGALERVELVVVPNAGHVLNLTAPQVFNEKLRAVLGAASG